MHGPHLEVSPSTIVAERLYPTHLEPPRLAKRLLKGQLFCDSGRFTSYKGESKDPFPAFPGEDSSASPRTRSISNSHPQRPHHGAVIHDPGAACSSQEELGHPDGLWQGRNSDSAQLPVALAQQHDPFGEGAGTGSAVVLERPVFRNSSNRPHS